MAIASGARTQIGYVIESAQGVQPASPITLKLLRLISRGLNLSKNILTSQEVRADRQQADVRHGLQRADGSLNFELGLSTFDDMLEAVMGGTWTTITMGATGNLGITTGTNVLTRTSGSFITDGIRPGDVLRTATFVNGANNGNFTVLTVAALSVTLDPGAGVFVTEAPAAGPTITMPGKRLDVGKLLKTFTFERQFTDLLLYQPFNGVAMNALDLSVKPEAIVNGTLGLIGMITGAITGTTMTTAGGGSVTNPATNAPFASFEGSMFEGGAKIALVTGVDYKLDNGRQLGAVVGSKTSPGVFEGTLKATGTLNAYLQDAVLYNKFLNETESKMYVRLNDLNGTDFHQIVIPRLKYNGDNIEPPPEGPIVQGLPWKGLVDAVTGTTISWQRSN